MKATATVLHERIPTRISPDILDTIGKSFKFNHGKGAAEWLKNSLDHYLRLHEVGEESLDGGWPAFINLINGRSQKNGPNLVVLDLGGTSYANVTEFFLHWGDRKAATFGGTARAAPVTGGHGNGGKFYMREMWRGGARLLTWRGGRATSLVVDKASDGTTGEWELKDHPIGWREAMRFALPEQQNLGGAEWMIADLEQNKPNFVSELDIGARGFTVVAGRHAVQRLSSNDVVRGGRWDIQRLVDDLRGAPQARRPIRELHISLFVDGSLRLARLTPDEVENDPDWEIQELAAPLELLRDDQLRNGATIVGLFTLRKAAQQLVGRTRHLNGVVVTDAERNPIAFYPVRELPIPGHSPLLAFLYADLRLIFPEVDGLVENDRERLVPCETTSAILEWMADRTWDRVRALEDQQRDKERRSDLELASALNKALNDHARRFLQQMQTEILVDFIEDPEGGGMGDEGDGIGPLGVGPGGERERDAGRGGGKGTGGTAETPGEAKKKRRPQFPRVLLSGFDPDPSKSDGSTKGLTDRHPPLHQDDLDLQFNVWWINTSHPFADEAMRREGPKGAPFKSYQLFMVLEVVQREALRMIQRREAELGLDVVENELSEISNRFLASLPRDLAQSLLQA